MLIEKSRYTSIMNSFAWGLFFHFMLFAMCSLELKIQVRYYDDYRLLVKIWEIDAEIYFWEELRLHIILFIVFWLFFPDYWRRKRNASNLRTKKTFLFSGAHDLKASEVRIAINFLFLSSFLPSRQFTYSSSSVCLHLIQKVAACLSPAVKSFFQRFTEAKRNDFVWRIKLRIWTSHQVSVFAVERVSNSFTPSFHPLALSLSLPPLQKRPLICDNGSHRGWARLIHMTSSCDTWRMHEAQFATNYWIAFFFFHQCAGLKLTPCQRSNFSAEDWRLVPLHLERSKDASIKALKKLRALLRVEKAKLRNTESALLFIMLASDLGWWKAELAIGGAGLTLTHFYLRVSSGFANLMQAINRDRVGLQSLE